MTKGLVHLTYEERLRAGTVQSVEGKALWGCPCVQIPNGGGVKKTEPLFSVALV